jgi:hypothetical protein
MYPPVQPLYANKIMKKRKTKPILSNRWSLGCHLALKLGFSKLISKIM